MSFWGGAKKAGKFAYRLLTDDGVQAVLRIVPGANIIAEGSERVEDLVEKLKGAPEGGETPNGMFALVQENNIMLKAILKHLIAEQEAGKK